MTAIDGISLEIDDEISGLMGPNGSGKSTFVNCITGVHQPSDGQVFHDGDNITNEPAYKIARHGMARTFQTPHIFESLTVLQNVMVPLLNTQRDREEIETEARESIEMVGLSHLVTEEARALSGGQKKLLEFARCVMRNPDIVFMDEPFAGVHAEIKKTLNDKIQNLNDEGTDFLIVSHEVSSLYNVSDRIHVFDRGRLILSGEPEDVQDNEAVVNAYLGDKGQ